MSFELRKGPSGPRASVGLPDCGKLFIQSPNESDPPVATWVGDADLYRIGDNTSGVSLILSNNDFWQYPDQQVPTIKYIGPGGFYAFRAMARASHSDVGAQTLAIGAAVNNDLLSQNIFSDVALTFGCLPILVAANQEEWLLSDRLVELETNDLISLVIACSSSSDVTCSIYDLQFSQIQPLS